MKDELSVATCSRELPFKARIPEECKGTLEDEWAALIQVAKSAS